MSQNKRDWDVHPPYLYSDYKSTILRAPSKPLKLLKHSLSEMTGPVYGLNHIGVYDNDLTINARKNGEPLGERIVLAGRITEPHSRNPRKGVAGKCGRSVRS